MQWIGPKTRWLAKDTIAEQQVLVAAAAGGADGRADEWARLSRDAGSGTADAPTKGPAGGRPKGRLSWKRLRDFLRGLPLPVPRIYVRIWGQAP